MLKDVKRISKMICASLTLLCLIITTTVFAADNLVKQPSFEFSTQNDDLIISQPTLMVGGNILETLEPNSTVNVSAKVRKVSAGEIGATLCVALFSAENQFKNVKTESCNLSGSYIEDTLTCDAEFGSDVSPTDYIKLFIWSDLDTMIPYVRTFKNGTTLNDNFIEDSNWKFEGSSWKVTDICNVTHATFSSTYGYNSLTLMGSGTTGDIAYQDITVEPNKFYVLSYLAMTRSSDLTDNRNYAKSGYFKCSIKTNDGKVINSMDSDIYSGMFYGINRFIFNSGDNTALRVEFTDISTDSSINSFVTDVCVNNNLCAFGDFENNMIAAYHKTYKGSFEMNNCTTELYYPTEEEKCSENGNVCLKCTPVTDGKEMSLQFDFADICENAGNGAFKAEVMVKYNKEKYDASSDTPLFILSLVYSSAQTPITQYGFDDKLIEIGNGWYKLPFEFNMADKFPKENAKIKIRMVRPNGAMYVDNLSLVKVNDDIAAE